MEEPNRRLELRFRPDDVFCKPACGEKHPSSSLLLRFEPFHLFFLFLNVPSRVKKRRLKAGREGTGKPAVKLDTSIEGVVPTTYRWYFHFLNLVKNILNRFGSLCDFQYLCMERKDDELKSLYPQVHFSLLLLLAHYLYPTLRCTLASLVLSQHPGWRLLMPLSSSHLPPSPGWTWPRNTSTGLLITKT